MSNKADWIAVDWGTTNLRLWALGPAGDVIAALQSDKGMGGLERDAFEPSFLELAGQYLAENRKTQVLICGMAGARQGWAEVPYAKVPCKPAEGRALKVLTLDERLDVRILPGVSQAQPADVMRGEETQIAGYLANNPNYDGILCLPGTHSKWVHISAGEIVSFRTYMTGELFALLAGQSVLRHGLKGGDSWDHEAFAEALGDAMSRPESFAAALFSLRAEGLLQGLSPGSAYARLSGLLIGMELAGARPYWLGQRVVLIGADAIISRYSEALGAQGVSPEIAPSGGMSLAGLTAARMRMKETS